MTAVSIRPPQPCPIHTASSYVQKCDRYWCIFQDFGNINILISAIKMLHCISHFWCKLEHRAVQTQSTLYSALKMGKGCNNNGSTHLVLLDGIKEKYQHQAKCLTSNNLLDFKESVWRQTGKITFSSYNGLRSSKDAKYQSKCLIFTVF